MGSQNAHSLWSVLASRAPKPTDTYASGWLCLVPRPIDRPMFIRIAAAARPHPIGA